MSRPEPLGGPTTPAASKSPAQHRASVPTAPATKDHDLFHCQIHKPSRHVRHISDPSITVVNIRPFTHAAMEQFSVNKDVQEEKNNITLNR